MGYRWCPWRKYVGSGWCPCPFRYVSGPCTSWRRHSAAVWPACPRPSCNTRLSSCWSLSCTIQLRHSAVCFGDFFGLSLSAFSLPSPDPFLACLFLPTFLSKHPNQKICQDLGKILHVFLAKLQQDSSKIYPRILQIMDESCNIFGDYISRLL